MNIETTNKNCGWSRSDPDADLWEGSCGVSWCLTEGTPTENEVKFCPNCGRPVEQLQDEPEETDDEVTS